MNVSIPIEKLIPTQVTDHYETLYNKIMESDTGDQFISMYQIDTPLTIYKCSAGDQRLVLKQIYAYLDESDQEDYFGTEGWKHAFNMD